MSESETFPTEQMMQRHLRRCLLLIGVLTGLFILYILFKPGSASLFTTGDDVGAGVIEIVALLLALPLMLPRGARPSRPREAGIATRLANRAPLLLALGIGSYVIGQALWTINEDVLHLASLFPSWADAGFLLVYPSLLLGLLLLPRHPLTFVTRTRVVADSLMIMTGVVTFTWYFLLGPTLLQGGTSLLARVVSAAYPLADPLLVGCLLLLAAHTGETVLRRAVLPFALGLSVLTVSDFIFGYQELHNTYVTGTLLDVGWPLGFLLIGLGMRAVLITARMMPETSAAESEVLADWRDPLLSLWRALLPYAFIPAVIGLIIVLAWTNGDPRLEQGVYVGGLVLVAIVLLRQVLARIENVQLYRQVQTQNHTLTDVNARLEALATTDPLTELPNHRAMVAALDQELARAQRYARGFAVLFVDIDHFKLLNDDYGHAQGDGALHEFAKLLRATVRGIDTVGRWGGEEFLVVLPEVDAADALTIAERMRAAIAGYRFGATDTTHLTSSIGVAAYPHDGEERDALVHAADRAMYVAKRLGRNQVRAADDPAVMALAHANPRDGEEDETVLLGIVEALAAMVNARDHCTGAHAHAVATLAMHLAVILGLPAAETRNVGVAGRLHDIGKVAVPDAILLKPAQLTAEEWTLMRRHPAVGAEIVSWVSILREAVPLIQTHHERWDGMGYPDGMIGEAIPRGARIIAVADAYCAMMEDRPYRKAYTPAVALQMMERGAGTQFDATVVAALIHYLNSVAEAGTTEGAETYTRLAAQA